MEQYNPQQIEKKWREIWEKRAGKFEVEDFSKKTKFYSLVEFPYPSGSGLHVGHCMGYTASDVHARMMRMRGYNVLFPIGWDAFGLPTENYAIKTGRKPAEVTKENTDCFRKQMKALAYSFDWDREIDTTDPNYYRWTQWIFLQFYKHGYVDGKLVEIADDDATTPRLAYQAEMPINWCPDCKIGLANEEVIDGKCERCGAVAYKKMQKQWMLRITAYADRLIEDLAKTDYLEKIKGQQINWIGRSEGARIKFKIVIDPRVKPEDDDGGEMDPRVKPEDDGKGKIASSSGSSPGLKADRNDGDVIEVFTTRVDTLFGCTYVVLSPEHPVIKSLQSSISNLQEVEEYIEKAGKKSDLERMELIKDKTGVKLEGIQAINPINNEPVDVWVADYILASYGTGAVMAVPAHDQRDFEFAVKYNIFIKQAIAPFYSTNVGPDGVQKNKNTVKRKMITAIVKHWSDDKVFCLNWEKFNWHSFILGGIDEGESGEEAARREVIEESGYQNIKAIKKIGFETHSNFFARHKGVNRYSMSDCYIVELDDGRCVEPEKEHVKNHKGIWIDSKQVKNYINLSNNVYYWDIYKNGEQAFVDYGVLINSGEFDGLTSEDAKKKITEKLKKMGSGDFSVNYKLRDWVFSRQHYWGEPIPIIYCEKCGLVPVPEEQLPIKLPDVEKYEPTNTGESPLAAISDWVNTKCPACGGEARRETDTMPNWAGSSWYYAAYAMNNELRIMNYEGKTNIFKENEKELVYWLPVDLYNGGMEHTTLHLLYSRFWHKFLYDLKHVPTLEPYQKRIAHGIILGPDGQKMSKSKGNVIIPDEIVDKYGADTMRTYIMFIGPYDQESAWNINGLIGVHRFLNRVWKNQDLAKERAEDSKELLVKLNQTIKGVTEDLEEFRMNTVVSKLMEMNNKIEEVGSISWALYMTFLRLLFVVAPFLASELYHAVLPVNDDSYLEDGQWPVADEKYLSGDESMVAVQINGKIRGTVKVPTGSNEDVVVAVVMAQSDVCKWLADKKIVKMIFKQDKIISFVV